MISGGWGTSNCSLVYTIVSRSIRLFAKVSQQAKFAFQTATHNFHTNTHTSVYRQVVMGAETWVWGVENGWGCTHRWRQRWDATAAIGVAFLLHCTALAEASLTRLGNWPLSFISLTPWLTTEPGLLITHMSLSSSFVTPWHDVNHWGHPTFSFGEREEWKIWLSVYVGALHYWQLSDPFCFFTCWIELMVYIVKFYLRMVGGFMQYRTGPLRVWNSRISQGEGRIFYAFTLFL